MVDYDIFLGLQNMPISGADGNVTASLSTYFGGLSVDGGFFIEDGSPFYLGYISGSLPAPSESVAGELRFTINEINTGSLYFHNGNDYIKLNTNTNFNYAFSTDPSTVTFVTIPTGSNNERAFTFKYLLSSGSSAANIAQGQVVGDGSGVAQVNLFATSSVFGGVSPTITAAYSGDGIDLKATFVGSDYIISGSYSSVI